MYNIAIADDEEKFIEQIINYIRQYEEKENVRIKIATFKDGADIVQNYEPQYDLIMLDIEMPKLNGMDAARIIREKDEDVVLMFITNMAEYAIHGYEVGALDFVMKPISYAAFAMRFSRALKRVVVKKKEQIMLNLPSGMKPIELSQIYYIEIQGHTLTYHTSDGNFELKGTMTSVEEKMSAYPFAKCNNWCLVNLAHVKETKGNEIIVGQDKIDMSRRNKTAFLKSLTEYVGGKM